MRSLLLNPEWAWFPRDSLERRPNRTLGSEQWEPSSNRN